MPIYRPCTMIFWPGRAPHFTNKLRFSMYPGTPFREVFLKKVRPFTLKRTAPELRSGVRANKLSLKFISGTVLEIVESVCKYCSQN